jgi:hypothetical protein
MATFMPPWPEWQVEYVGSSFLGKLLGLWSASWVRLLTAVFRSFGTDAETRGQHNSNRARLSIFEVGAKLFRLAISNAGLLESGNPQAFLVSLQRKRPPNYRGFVVSAHSPLDDLSSLDLFLEAAQGRVIVLLLH